MEQTNLPILNTIDVNRQWIYDDQGMRNVFEDHLPWLRERAGVHRVDPKHAAQYQYDFSNYLKIVLNVPVGLHWLYMRLNNMYYNWDFIETTQFLYLPKESDIDKLIGEYQSMF